MAEAEAFKVLEPEVGATPYAIMEFGRFAVMNRRGRGAGKPESLTPKELSGFNGLRFSSFGSRTESLMPWTETARREYCRNPAGRPEYPGNMAGRRAK